MFFDYARKCLVDSTEFDQKKFDNDISEFEWRYCETPYKLQPKASDNPVELLKNIYRKYISYFDLFNDSTSK